MLMAVPEVLPEVIDRISAIDLTDHRDVLDSAEPAGIPALRRAIAERMTIEGLATAPEQIVVTAGAQQGIALLTMRSEEHTSELQSLMRISYAVFCLKKKIKKK